MKESTIAGKKHCSNQIFEYWESAGLRSSKDISPESVYDFLEARTYFFVATKERYQYILRDLIGYLHKNSLCKPGLLKLFPIISVHSKESKNVPKSDEDYRTLALTMEKELLRANNKMQKLEDDLKDRDRRIARLTTSLEEKTNECEVLRGEIFIISKKAKIMGTGSNTGRDSNT